MKQGDYPAAWRLSERILAQIDPVARDDPSLPYHLRWVWNGQPLAQRHVLVRCYHGLGDTVQFSRFLPALASVCAHLTVEVQPQLLPLLRSIQGVDRWIPFDRSAPALPSDCDVEIMELPFALKMTPEMIRPPYLTTPVAALPPRTVGLCWEAGDWDMQRSVPEDLLQALAGRPAVTLLPRPTKLAVLNPHGAPEDILGTAALIAGADLIITVDTMAAHLSGALNRPTWLLLKHDADWRWMADRTDSPWYPSMRLYRQATSGDWGSVMARVTEDLDAIFP